ncbi:MAG: hypothetical protein ACPGJV_02760 [Bacteriovoracaceae bacterium]
MNKEVLNFDDSIISETLPSEDVLLEGRVENLEIENSNQQTSINSNTSLIDTNKNLQDDIQNELTEHKEAYADDFVSDSIANIQLMPRKAGRRYYATDEKLFYGDDGVDVISVGGGAGLGTVNEQDTVTLSLPDDGGLHKIRLAPVASQTLSTTPFGSDDSSFLDGMLVTLIGTSDTNTTTIEHNDIDYGCILNGNITLSKFAIITLAYDLTFKRFIEVSRNV